jgi:hypothetical protein
MINSSIVGLVVIGIVAVVLLVFVIKPQRRLPEERGLTPLFNARCSATTEVGFRFRFGTNMPTCRITLYENAMVIAVGTPAWVRYEDIVNAKCERSWWASRLKLSTRVPKMAVTLNLRSPEKVAGILREKGVKVIEY